MWDIVSIVVCVASAVFFWLIFANRTGTGLYVGVGLGVIVFFVILLAQSYFDTQVQMNAPNKTVFQFAVLAAMLLTLNELRVGQEIKKPVFHLFATTAAVIYMSASSVPSIIGYLTGNMPVNYNLFFADGVLLLFTVFAVARLCQLCFDKQLPAEDSPTETVYEAETEQATVTEENN